MESDSKNKRLAKNTIYLYIRMLFAVCINLYTSRLLLKYLGVEDYGVYNFVGGIVALMMFVNTAMSGAILLEGWNKVFASLIINTLFITMSVLVLYTNYRTFMVSIKK